MLDIKFIRENPDKIKEGCRKKQVKCDIDRLLELDEKKRQLLQEIEGLKAEQNKISEQRTKNNEQLARAKQLKEKIKELAPDLSDAEKKLNDLSRQIPNLPLDEVPEGKDESANKVLRQEGKKPKLSAKGGQKFQPQNYLNLTEKLDIIDIERAAKVSGTRFSYLKGGAVLLEFALVQLALEVLNKEGFVPVVPPVMLKEKPMAGMGYLDQGADEVYHLEKDDLYLVGTSEQSMGVMHMDEILKEKELPKRYVGFSTCFRREAGAYGKDTKGILRVHQFDKVEMFSFCLPANSKKEHLFLLSTQEKLVKLLEIPYQVVQLSTGDLAGPSAATYDIEAWMPGQNQYRETHSTSNCTDFQARRLNIRYRPDKNGQLAFVHTLNGTAFAIGRTLIAIFENYQQADGSIKVPKVLKKYMGKIDQIG
ncbi:MAG: serine--tRNA ligase [Candidatus Portnoybacteria bacterium CG03_land_8_20_14_0_80_41_10]|uniref:Serine--tRNA ligase n=1 Tax=Candidatus Portnoybacteria bacterium CG03_land_8_20_14_0_80_41_10 TaxID=1974808 RepID=A0A2M7BUT0_9BACT|nr:MAG: serine--tRNA ligase [Candidatus Portnoybacteria bacterium CG03_land_8_20_14_0_80_41_10]